MKNYKLLDRLLLEVSKESFNDALNFVATIHGENPEWEHFVEKITIINTEHLQIELMGKEVPPLPASVEAYLEGFLPLFDSINFSDPAKPNYVDPTQILREAEVDSVAKLREGLFHKKDGAEVGLIGYVKRQISYAGTPAAGDQLKFFYTQIERALKHVLIKLNTLPNTEEANQIRASVITDLIRACPPKYCGGRIFSNAIQLYGRIVQGIQPTFENRVYQTLADFRDTLLQSIMEGPNVHEYNFLAKMLGKELGLAVADLMTAFDDKYMPDYLQDIDIGAYLSRQKKKFFERYTPSAIIAGWLKPQLETDFALKSACMDWFKEHTPADFEAQKFRRIRAHVQAGKMTLNEISEWAFKEFQIELTFRTFEEELKGAIDSSARDQMDAKKSAIESEIEALDKAGKPDHEIREIMKSKYGIDAGSGSLQRAILSAMDREFSSLKEQFSKRVHDRVTELRGRGMNDEAIAKKLREKDELNVFGYTPEQWVEEARRRLYLEKEVIYTDTKMRFKEERLYELCKALKVIKPFNEGLELQPQPMHD